MRKLLIIASFVGLVACGGRQDTGDDQPESMPVAATASVRVVHASTAPPVRVYNADGFTFGPVGTAQWSDRSDFPAGAGEFTFGPAGGGEAFAAATVDFAAGGAYSLILAGDHTSVVRAEMPTVFVTEDDLSAADEGRVHVRFVHAALGTGAVALSDGQGRGYAAGLEYGGTSAWYSVDPANGTVDIAVGGEVVASLPAPFTVGFATTVVIVPDGDGVAAYFVNDQTN